MAAWAPTSREADIRVGRLDAAAATLATLDAQAQKTGGGSRTRRRARRGLMADADAEACFERALAWHDGVRLRSSAPDRTLPRRTAPRDGRRGDARAPLRRALTTFERLDAEPWAERTRAEPARPASGCGGARPRRSTSSRRRSCASRSSSPRAPTNREAAATLFVTPKTIETHLKNASPQLGIRSRVELARPLPRRPRQRHVIR